MNPCQSLGPAANTLKRTRTTTGPCRPLRPDPYGTAGDVSCTRSTTAPFTETAWPLAIPVTASLSRYRSNCTMG
eukprot:11062603-Alexandrium_andersonii.AAC.1